ncbi:MAG: ABC transporter permease [Phycisphaerales bacterium]|nr:MAG: ABC transporter permease [Phycisphaerales bacterium]
MRASWRLALNNLAGKRGRTVLILGAAIVACSLIVAMSSAIATVQASMEWGFSRFLGSADVRIVHQFNGRFDETLLEIVRNWRGVEDAMGYLSSTITVTAAGKDHQAEDLQAQLVYVVGADLDRLARFRPITLIEGRTPETTNEVLIGPMTVENLNVGVGDRLLIKRVGEPIELIVTGIFERKLLGLFQQPLIRADRRIVAEATGHPGELSSMMIKLRAGEDADAFCAEHLEELPPALSVEPAALVRAGFNRQIHAGRIGMVIASMLTFMSAAFIIVIGLTAGVIERQRELAMMRAVGATRWQLVLAQLLVGLVIGLAGLVVGGPLGILLAAALNAYYRDMLPGGLAISQFGVWLAVVGSVCAGLLGAAFPAYLASRVTPLQAMIRPAQPTRARNVFLATIVAAALIATPPILFAVLTGSEIRFWSYTFIGVPLLFTGYFILAVPVLILAGETFGRVLAVILRLPVDLLRGSVLATPFRHGLTAGVLMLGLALLIDARAVHQSMMSDWIEQIRFADGFAFRITGIKQAELDAIAALPYVVDLCPISRTQVRTLDRQVFGVEGVTPPYVTCVGFEPEVFFRMNKIDWAQGEEATAVKRLKQGDAVLVADRFLTARGVSVGDRIALGDGRVRKEFEIVGVISSAGLDVATFLFGIRSVYLDYAISCVFMDYQTAAYHFDSRDAYMLQVNLTEEIGDEEATAGIMAAAPGVVFRSGRWVKETIDELSGSAEAVETTVAFGALVLACIAAGNVIAADIRGRRFEYGVLRATGGGRWLLARLILAEAAVLAIAGAIVGSLLGMHFATIDISLLREMAGLDLVLRVPIGPMIIGWLAVVVMTCLAATPAVIALLRRRPGTLLASGRNE